jgi:hypothetical protein
MWTVTLWIHPHWHQRCGMEPTRHCATKFNIQDNAIESQLGAYTSWFAGINSSRCLCFRFNVFSFFKLYIRNFYTHTIYSVSIINVLHIIKLLKHCYFNKKCIDRDHFRSNTILPTEMSNRQRSYTIANTLRRVLKEFTRKHVAVCLRRISHNSPKTQIFWMSGLRVLAYQKGRSSTKFWNQNVYKANKLIGLSLRVNCTDQATAACW